MFSERFAGVHIGQMYFYKCNFGCQQGIAYRHAGMGKCGRIDNYKIDALLIRCMNLLNYLVFGIALQKV
jgi:hypothetical protein